VVLGTGPAPGAVGAERCESGLTRESRGAGRLLAAGTCAPRQSVGSSPKEAALTVRRVLLLAMSRCFGTHGWETRFHARVPRSPIMLRDCMCSTVVASLSGQGNQGSDREVERGAGSEEDRAYRVRKKRTMPMTARMTTTKITANMPLRAEPKTRIAETATACSLTGNEYDKNDNRANGHDHGPEPERTPPLIRREPRIVHRHDHRPFVRPVFPPKC
jgi:hypothetical protein